MNNFPFITIVGWETRNWRKQKKALVACKDYGLRSVTRDVYISELFPKEKAEMQERFKSIFDAKTDRFFFATMCKSCFNGSKIDMKLQEKIMGLPTFELIQMPENL